MAWHRFRAPHKVRTARYAVPRPFRNGFEGALAPIRLPSDRLAGSVEVRSSHFYRISILNRPIAENSQRLDERATQTGELVLHLGWNGCISGTRHKSITLQTP